LDYVSALPDIGLTRSGNLFVRKPGYPDKLHYLHWPYLDVRNPAAHLPEVLRRKLGRTLLKLYGHFSFGYENKGVDALTFLDVGIKKPIIENNKDAARKYWK
jgi:hypothetical protein